MYDPTPFKMSNLESMGSDPCMTEIRLDYYVDVDIRIIPDVDDPIICIPVDEIIIRSYNYLQKFI